MTELTLFGSPVERWALLGVASVIIWLLIELLLLHFWRRRLDLGVARMTLFGVLSQVVAAPILTILLGPVSVGILALLANQIAPFEAGIGAFGWLYGFVVYEFFYWLQHWLAHKVRLLWCIHSPHHAPEGIHMAIGVNHHFLEGLLYFPIFFGFLPALFGVDPLVAVVVNVVDMVWGSYLHLSDEIVRKGRYGVLGRFMQTPAHHRVHHARNPRYLDRNYNSITLLWDWVFGTLEPLDDAEAVDFGITRPVRTESYWDVHFGEFVALWRDVRSASTLAEAAGYVFRPPGWAPGDPSGTASARRAAWLVAPGGAEQAMEPVEASTRAS